MEPVEPCKHRFDIHLLGDETTARISDELKFRLFKYRNKKRIRIKPMLAFSGLISPHGSVECQWPIQWQIDPIMQASFVTRLQIIIQLLD